MVPSWVLAMDPFLEGIEVVLMKALEDASLGRPKVVATSMQGLKSKSHQPMVFQGWHLLMPSWIRPQHMHRTFDHISDDANNDTNAMKM